ncbi:MAG: ABC transporter permease [Paracoccaceae bacterium]|nr:MAG: ABC transporter permease [Paracoccaceae bacterium]
MSRRWPAGTAPPALATVNDSWGIALMLGLMVKEVPFLVLVMLSALSQIPVGRHLAAARALGYARGVAWIKVILPQLWPMIRLPVLVVLSYGLSVVDMAIILGPSNPPTLAVALTRWFADPDPAMILPASAGALLQAGLVALAAGLVLGAEAAARPLGRWWLRRGGRGLSAGPGLRLAGGAVAGLMALGVLSLLALALWSLAWRWPWPAVLPQEWSAALWAGAGGGWADALANTVILAAASAGLGLVLAVLWLEAETGARFAAWVRPLVYLPLLVPQIGFLYGLNVGLLQIGLSGGMAAVVWAQLLFVFPYVIIALGDPWRRLDPRLIRAAAALGAGPLRRLWAVKLPVLLRPVLTAAAIGVAVSVAQYLPTLFMGAGRIATLTTEAVTLSSGADRRVTGVYGTLQAAVPLIGYAAALAVPALVHRNRRALWGAAPA